MKTLHLLRHGKSSWDYISVHDLDRPLIEKGIRNTFLIGERLFQNYSSVNAIVSSPANRALHTAVIMARCMNFPFQKISINDAIYTGNSKSILDFIFQFDNKVDSLMLVGHNPDFTELANAFLPEPIENLPTSGIASIQFDVENWSEIVHANKIISVDYPKKLLK